MIGAWKSSLPFRYDRPQAAAADDGHTWHRRCKVVRPGLKARDVWRQCSPDRDRRPSLGVGRPRDRAVRAARAISAHGTPSTRRPRTRVPRRRARPTAASRSRAALRPVTRAPPSLLEAGRPNERRGWHHHVEDEQLGPGAPSQGHRLIERGPRRRGKSVGWKMRRGAPPSSERCEVRGERPRHTKTGIRVWVSTFVVSLPSTSAAIPRRPCEAMKIRSHPLVLAVSIMA
jgi:hypothetical protein